MKYVHQVDLAAFKPSEFHSMLIADGTAGLDSCTCIATRVPPGKGTTIGLHAHPVDQFYFVLTGTMSLKIVSKQFTAAPNSLVYTRQAFPTGTGTKVRKRSGISSSWFLRRPPARPWPE